MTRYLVTGGCGFIGSHLCDALISRGHGVRVLDDLSTGSLDNLAPGAEFLRGDVADPAAVRRAMDGVDGCFHLAAIASVERGTREWLETHRVNLSATVALFEQAARGSCKVPVVYASSAAVYGDNADLPLREDAATRPLSAYGADKLGCELHARVAGAVHGVPTLGLRFFNVFGPRQDPRSPYSGVISIFCDRLSRDESVTFYGDGSQTRDFIFVADVVRALIAAFDHAALDAPALNVCSGRPTSVAELAEVIAGLCGAELRVAHAAPRMGEIRHSLGARDGAAAKLALPMPTSLRDGLAETIAWVRDRRVAARV